MPGTPTLSVSRSTAIPAVETCTSRRNDALPGQFPRRLRRNGQGYPERQELAAATKDADESGDAFERGHALRLYESVSLLVTAHRSSDCTVRGMSGRLTTMSHGQVTLGRPRRGTKLCHGETFMTS